MNVSLADELTAIRLRCGQQFQQQGQWITTIASKNYTGAIMGLMKQGLFDVENHLHALTMLTGREIASTTLLTNWECNILRDELKDPTQEKWSLTQHGYNLIQYAEFEQPENNAGSSSTVGLRQSENERTIGELGFPAREPARSQAPALQGTCYFGQDGLPYL